MSDHFIISNGKMLFQTNQQGLEQAAKYGFYCPSQQNRVLVTDGDSSFEIPRQDLDEALLEGFTVVTDGAESPAAMVSKYRQAELIEERKRAELEARLAEASGLSKPFIAANLWWHNRGNQFGKGARTSAISIALHLAVALLLSSILFLDDTIENPGFITVDSPVSDPIEEIVIEPVEVEMNEEVEEVVEETSEPMEVISEVTEQFVSVDVMPSTDGLLAAPESSSGSEGDGKDMTPTKNKLKFFNAQTEAIDFVFVIDNSNSMTRGRFETALNELVKAVSKLNRKQKFYVIFYSDTAYPLFYPYPARSLIPATDRNKQLLAQWVQTVPLCLRTDGKEALNLGFSLKPDIMFVLGDGAFTDKASQFFVANPNKEVVVHTLGMEVSGQNAKQFEQLAKKHRGTYQDVGVHPQAALIAKKFPRPRNNKRNGIWGIKLGNKKK